MIAFKKLFIEVFLCKPVAIVDPPRVDGFASATGAECCEVGSEFFRWASEVVELAIAEFAGKVEFVDACIDEIGLKRFDFGGAFFDFVEPIVEGGGISGSGGCGIGVLGVGRGLLGSGVVGLGSGGILCAEGGTVDGEDESKESNAGNKDIK